MSLQGFKIDQQAHSFQAASGFAPSSFVSSAGGYWVNNGGSVLIEDATARATAMFSYSPPASPANIKPTKLLLLCKN
jgi:hypothetical protein